MFFVHGIIAQHVRLGRIAIDDFYLASLDRLEFFEAFGSFDADLARYFGHQRAVLGFDIGLEASLDFVVRSGDPYGGKIPHTGGRRDDDVRAPYLGEVDEFCLIFSGQFNIRTRNIAQLLDQVGMDRFSELPMWSFLVRFAWYRAALVLRRRN